MLIWTFDREFCPIECRPYVPAVVTPPCTVRRGLGWRAFGRLLAGALWGGVVAGILIAHGRVEILALIF